MFASICTFDGFYTYVKDGIEDNVCSSYVTKTPLTDLLTVLIALIYLILPITFLAIASLPSFNDSS